MLNKPLQKINCISVIFGQFFGPIFFIRLADGVYIHVLGTASTLSEKLLLCEKHYRFITKELTLNILRKGCYFMLCMIFSFNYTVYR